MFRLVSFLVLLSLIAPCAPDAAERAWIDVTVRVYDVAPVAAADKTRALAIAAAVLAPVGLEIHFRDCAVTIAEPSCGDTLGPDELALRLVRSPAPRVRSTAPQALGDALVDRRRRKGALATIYLERVEWLAGESRADATLLLGRAIAHELVHTFSGQSTHAPRGLMRAVWSSWEVARDRAEDWRLQDAEKALLRSRRQPDSVRAALR